MPWKRHDSDPLLARRRALDEQARQLAEKQKQLTEELQGRVNGAGPGPVHHPVWRTEEEDAPRARTPDLAPTRGRHLGRQRQRDMVLFFVFIAILIVLVIVGWLAYAHLLPTGGASPAAAS